MVMWIHSRGRLLLRKLLRIVMNNKRSKVEENASNTGSPSTSQLHYHDDPHHFHLSVLQYQESRSRQLQNLILHNSYLSTFRLNPFPVNTRAISTTQQVNPTHSGIHQQSQTPSQNDFQKHKNDPIPLRQWTDVEKESNEKRFTFKVMSYNVLAQILMDRHRELYSANTHKSRYLNWNYRWDLLRQEFTFHDADIVCLQEVQESHFNDFYSFFRSLGYDGIFKQRTGTEYPDGCAIFYKTKVLQMIDHQMVEYYQPGTSILNRNNVAIVAKFTPRSLGHSFVVATTHLLFNPKREDVRLAQTQVLLTEINRFSYDSKTQENIPVILCGDFNSEMNGSPNCVYQLITDKRIDYTNIHHRRDDRSWLPPKLGITNGCKYLSLAPNNKVLSSSEERNTFESGQLSHDFNFTSVYSNGGVTTNQDRWITVDYLFFSATNRQTTGELKCLKRFELPTANGLKNKGIKGIPNCRLGSDHFALVAEFEFGF